MMQLCKVKLPDGKVQVGTLSGGQVRLLGPTREGKLPSLSDVLYAEDPAATAEGLLGRGLPLPLSKVTLAAPIDRQEVWAAGVTYTRSREARGRESAGAAQFYDRVYTAPRPELFFKATPARVAGPEETVRVRRDSRWTVPEPELALVLSPRLHIVGYTIGNDMSARDIEGENPLYLPQAKVYDGCCALGPVITLAADMPPPRETTIRLTIERRGQAVFEGSIHAGAMARSFKDLLGWLGRDNSFPEGAVLLTGTGIVPPDAFTLTAGDIVLIEITGIGILRNVVEQQTALEG